MAYCLLSHKHQQRSFLIVQKQEWLLGNRSDMYNLIQEGDEQELLTFKERLEKEVVVFCHREEREFSSPPLAKISRVVTVTSSGNTKCSNSSSTFVEPFLESEEEYIPDVNENSSSSDDYNVENKLRRSRLPKYSKKVKKNINFGDGCSSERVEPTSVQPTSVQSTSVQSTSETSVNIDPSLSEDFPALSPISGEVTISGEQVCLDIYTSVHSGKFSVALETLPTVKPDSNILKGIFSEQNLEAEHKCHPVDARKPIGYVIHEENEKGTLIIHLNYCIRQGSAQGTFTFIEERQMRFSHLKFCDPFFDEEEEENPDRGTSTTNVDKPPTKLKQHYCLFCKQLKTCIWRHYKIKHAKEERVKEIVEASTSKKANQLMKTLRLEGDYEYNQLVSPFDRIPVRKHRIQMLSNSVHCSSCSGLIGARNYSRHNQRCAARPADKKRRLRHLQTMERLKRFPSQNDDGLFLSVISGMKASKERAIIEKDSLLKSLAIYLVKSQPKTHNLGNTRSSLTRLAKLFIAVQKKIEDSEKIEEVKDMFKPHLYGIVASCIRDICCFDQPYENRKSQLALVYGPLLSRAISRLKVELLKSDVSLNDERLVSLSNLQKIHDEEFKIEVTRQALVSTKHKRMSKGSELPSAKDISTLMKHIRQVGDEFYDRLTVGFDQDAWINLGKSLLCQLLVFNRRRVGEMSRATVDNFYNRKQVTPEYYKSLTMLETMLADKYSIFTIMAKRNRPVSILITKTQIEQLELFLQYRQQAGIPEDNRYLFATPYQKDGYLKASNVLRYFAHHCGVEKPELLKSTNLRKQVATMSQLFCLSHMDIEQLAAFLGHDRTVHESYYRLDEQNTQITKLSKFLNAVGDNSIFEHKGKTLDQLPVHLFNSDERTAVDTDDCDESGEESGEESGKESAEECAEGPNDESFTRRPKSPLPSTSSMVNEKRRTSYKLRRRSKLKVPRKLLSPGKKSTPHISPSKSPKTSRTPTTKQLLISLEMNGRRHQQTKKMRWTKAEKDVMMQEFGPHLQNRSLPSSQQCVEVKNRHPDLFKNREPHSIYCWIRNNLRK